MTKKKVSLTGAPAREKIIKGVNVIADAVKLTLGPNGRNFASGVRGGPIAISNDGVSLAKEIQGADEFEDIGVRAVREAATKTNEKAGDGTTTAVVLTQAILKALEFDTDAVNANPVADVRKVTEESKVVVDELNKMAVKIESKDELIEIARVSVEDESLAALVGGAQWEVGASGTVMVEEHNAPDDAVEFVYGVRMDNGYGTSRIANNPAKMSLELQNVHILVTNKVFNTDKDIRDLNGLFDSLIKAGATSVVLVGRAFDETAIGLCVKNIQMHAEGKGGFPIYPINAPYTDQDEIMEDLAASVGARFLNVSERQAFTTTTADVGMAVKVSCTRYEGIVTGTKRGENASVDAAVEKRVEHIKEKLKGDISPFERRNLEARLSQLSAGTAVIKVGAETEQERRYKKDKVDDCVNAVKAALREGVVPGAGLALATIADKYPAMKIAAALREPNRQIIKNAGGSLDIPAWVRDPLVVVRTGFEKASSIARSLATTEVIVNWREEKTGCCGTGNVAPSDDE